MNISELAKEAGFTGCLLPEEADDLIGGVFIDEENWLKPLERFAALVRAEALADPVKQEPVAWIYEGTHTKSVTLINGPWLPTDKVTPLYAAPVQPVKREVYPCPTCGKYQSNSFSCGHNQFVEYPAPVDAKAIRAKALEEAAKVCESLPQPATSTTLTHIPTIETCAAAIRGLK